MSEWDDDRAQRREGYLRWHQSQFLHFIGPATVKILAGEPLMNNLPEMVQVVRRIALFGMIMTWDQRTKDLLRFHISLIEPDLKRVVRLFAAGYKHGKLLIGILCLRSAVQYLHEEFYDIVGDLLYSLEVAFLEQTIEQMLLDADYHNSKLLEQLELIPVNSSITSHPWWSQAFASTKRLNTFDKVFGALPSYHPINYMNH